MEQVMRVLGIDYGDRHIGMALSDPLQIAAFPLGSYRLTGDGEKDAKFFLDLVARHNVEEIVIGYPLRMSGISGSRVDKTKTFAAWLEKAVKKPILFQDERLTTRQALHILKEGKTPASKKKSREDQLSAVIILSAYLERKRHDKNIPEPD